MHGMNNVKVINAQQARIIHQYTKEKLLKANAAAGLNKIRRCKQLIYLKYCIF
jgi:hypothetical protein